FVSNYKGGIKMFTSAIIPTDLSQESMALVKSLGKLKSFGLKKCLILQNTISGGDASPEAITATENMTIRAKTKILEDQGLEVDARRVVGLTAAEVNRISDEENIPFIIAGAKTRNVFSEVLLGEMAYNLIHTCRKPIFLLRLEDIIVDDLATPKAARDDYAKHILFPTDFSETAGMAFEALLKMLQPDVKKLTLMHVQDQTRLNPYLVSRLSEFNEVDAERLAELKKRVLEVAKIEVDTLITYGNPASDIIKTAKDLDIQLVVMGSQGRGFVRDFFIGSVGHNVARQSPSSVLLFPNI
ncbi:MAG TPA: universal stress protein, partial [Clostridiales bacterium]|nr:universal stress protein [Clostridiales bacterium]